MSFLDKIFARRDSWTGDYASFAEAQADASEIDGERYVDDVLARAKADARHDSRDPSRFVPHGTQRLMASLSLCDPARPPDQPLRVLDFGGALGVHYFDLKRAYQDALSFRWMVFETRHMAEAGQRTFSSEELSFAWEWGDAEAFRPEIIIASGSIHYTEDPIECFNRLESFEARHLIFDIVPLFPGAKDRLTIQKRPSRPGSYPSWFLSEERWLKLVETHHQVKLRWVQRGTSLELDGERLRNQGMLLERLATS